MSSANWQTLGSISPTALVDARNMLHSAAQWPSRAARVALAARDDDSHSNLSWETHSGLLRSHDLGRGCYIGLSVAEFSLVFTDESGIVDKFSLAGKGDRAAAAWTAKSLEKIGVDPAALDAPLPYDLPPQVLKVGTLYDNVDHPALAELGRWFANFLLVLEKIAAGERMASEVRCWPHHLDIATLVTLTGEGEDAATIGIGMSPGDGSYAEPYLYVTPWPYPAADNLPNLPTIGHWHTEGFLAAIAPAGRIVRADDQKGDVVNFLAEAITKSRQLHEISAPNSA